LRIQALRKVLDEIIPVATDDDDSPQPKAKLATRLTDLWSDLTVQQEVERLERTLWEPLGPDFLAWCKARGLSAVAQAFSASALSATEGVSEADLSLDVLWDATGPASIYLSETGSGGLGHAEAIVSGMRTGPELFSEGVRHALNFCPRDQLAATMISFMEMLVKEDNDGPIRSAVSRVRAAQDFRSLEEARETFTQALSNAGLDASRSFVVAAAARILRPGSSESTDRVAYLLNAIWRRESSRLGIEIDPNVFAYVCAAYAPAARRIASVLRDLSGGTPPSPGQVYRLVEQLLVQGCKHSCPECMGEVNRYNNLGMASRELASEWLGLRPPQLRLRLDQDWRSQIRDLVRGNAVAELLFENDQSAEVMAELQKLLAEELEVEAVLVPATISAIFRKGKSWVVQLQLRGFTA
jgi:plasmid stability protein